MTQTKSKQHLLELLCVIFAILIVYFHTLTFDFVWDDKLLISDNPYFLQKLHWLTIFKSNLWSLSSTEDIVPFYRPLTTLVFWMEYKIFGLNPAYFHLVNMVIHILCTVLIWYLHLQLHSSDKLRLIGTLFFAIHPVQASTVGFISCQGDLFAELCMLASVILWIKKPNATLLGYLLAFVGMLFKEAAVILPMIRISYLIIVEKKSFRNINVWLSFIPWAFYFPLRHLGIPPGNGGGILHIDKIMHNNGIVRLFAFLGRLIFPVPISQNYLPPELNVWLTSILTVVSIVIVYVFAKRTKCKPQSLFLIVWFMIGIFVISDWLGANLRFSDQLLYAPIAPLTLLFGQIQIRRSLFYAVYAIILIFAAVTKCQVGVWENDTVFWKNEMQFNPKDPTIFLNYLNSNKDFSREQTCKLYENLFDLLDKKYVRKIHYLTLYNLGVCQMEKNPLVAEKYFRGAMEVSSQFWSAKNNLIHVLEMQRKYDQAFELSKQLVQERPALFQSWRTLGVIQAKMGDFSNAVISLQKAAEINPTDPQIWQMISRAKQMDETQSSRTNNH